jgi:hypothetical protein
VEVEEQHLDQILKVLEAVVVEVQEQGVERMQ